MAIAQTSFHTGESHEGEVLKVLLSTLQLDDVLIQANALHTPPAFFNSAPSRAPTTYQQLCFVARFSLEDFYSLNSVMDLNFDTIYYGADISFMRSEIQAKAEGAIYNKPDYIRGYEDFFRKICSASPQDAHPYKDSALTPVAPNASNGAKVRAR